MFRLVLAAALCLALGGCGVLGAATALKLGGGAALGAAVASKVATIRQDVQTVDVAATDLLAAAKPLNEALCYVEPWKPHSDKAQAAIKALCANLPSDPQQLWTQTVAVYKAVKASDAANDPAPQPVPAL